MKIAIRGGHNYQSVGVSGLVDEVIENRRIYPLVIKWLKVDKQDVLDVTPQKMDRKSDLDYGILKADKWGADIFISIHFNKAYDNFEGSIGTEAWVNVNNKKAKDIAIGITKKLGELGYRNRGVKDGVNRGLYEIKNAKMASILVEVCFVEATEDVKLYKKLGADKVAKAIAEGIVGHSIEIKNDVKNKYGVITADVLNVMSGPGENCKIIGQLKKETRIQLYSDCGNGWYDIYFNNIGGYVLKKYIELL